MKSLELSAGILSIRACATTCNVLALMCPIETWSDPLLIILPGLFTIIRAFLVLTLRTSSDAQRLPCGSSFHSTFLLFPSQLCMCQCVSEYYNELNRSRERAGSGNIFRPMSFVTISSMVFLNDSAVLVRIFHISRSTILCPGL